LEKKEVKEKLAKMQSELQSVQSDLLKTTAVVTEAKSSVASTHSASETLRIENESLIKQLKESSRVARSLKINLRKRQKKSGNSRSSRFQQKSKMIKCP